MLKGIIVDEQPQAVQVLKTLIRKIPFLECAGSFSDSKSALIFLKDNAVDLIFLDIGKSVPVSHSSVNIFQQHAMVILIASNGKFAMEGFEHNVLDFLVKPVSFERFSRAADKAYKIKYPANPVKAVAATESLKGGYIFIKEATRLVRVELDEIYYVMGLKNYVSIFTKSQRIVSLQTMKQMEDLLPAHRFIRVHRSYFVAIDKIISVEKQQIHIKDKMIPVGNIYQSLFMKKLQKHSNP
jgi:DNA-binding LytR/AlgR family response regulator